MNIIQKLFRRSKSAYISFNNGESGGAYQTTEELLNEVADRIATQASKLTPQVIRKDDKGIMIKND